MNKINRSVLSGMDLLIWKQIGLPFFIACCKYFNVDKENPITEEIQFYIIEEQIDKWDTMDAFD
jgi:hypothetical protein